MRRVVEYTFCAPSGPSPAGTCQCVPRGRARDGVGGSRGVLTIARGMVSLGSLVMALPPLPSHFVVCFTPHMGVGGTERDRIAEEREAALGRREEALAEREAALTVREMVLAEREAALGRREEALAEREAALTVRKTAVAERMAAAHEILAAADKRDAISDSRDTRGETREQVLDQAHLLARGDAYGDDLPLRRGAALDREHAKEDRAASRDDRIALTESPEEIEADETVDDQP